MRIGKEQGPGEPAIFGFHRIRLEMKRASDSAEPSSVTSPHKSPRLSTSPNSPISDPPQQIGASGSLVSITMHEMK